MKTFLKFWVAACLVVFGMAIATEAARADGHVVDEPTYLITVFFDDYGVGYTRDEIFPLPHATQTLCESNGTILLKYLKGTEPKSRFVILCQKLVVGMTMNQMIADIVLEFTPHFPAYEVPVPMERSRVDPAKAPHYHDESDA